jgi:hypothetical protein
VLLTRNAKWLFALVLLVVAATVEAAPSIGSADAKVVALAVSPTSYTESSAVDEVELLISTNNPALSHIAADLLKPPAELTSRTALPSGIKPLPAVPAALFMALTGFLCVTLVRDRKVWLAIVTTLLWAGQVGITALPQKCRVCIAHHLNKRWPVPILPSLGERISRLRSELEGTGYIGLLHHLEGIPDAKRNTILDSRFSMLDEYRVSNIKHTSPQFASAISRTCFIPVLNCLSYEVRQFICFSPAFIFNSIPRSPPLVPHTVSFYQKGALRAAPFKLKISVT